MDPDPFQQSPMEPGEMLSHDERIWTLGNKRAKYNNIFALYKREHQKLNPLQFNSRMQVSDPLIYSLSQAKELEAHTGCVNCIEFNNNGDLLLSGSDDYTINVWDVNQQKKIKTIRTGHRGNIFSVKFLPQTNDTQIVSGAADFRIEVRDLHSEEVTHVCSCHAERVKRIAIVPNSPNIFLSASEDGTVLQFDLRTKHSCSTSPKNVLVNLKQHSGRNAEAKCVAVNPIQSELVAVGSNDAFVRVYDRRMVKLTSVQFPRSSTLRTSWERDNHSTTQPSFPDNMIPGCVQYYVPGYLPDKQKQYCKIYRTLATTYLSYSADGRLLLANLGGDNINLFDTTYCETTKTFVTPPSTATIQHEACASSTANGLLKSDHGPESMPTYALAKDLEWLAEYAKSNDLEPYVENNAFEAIRFYNRWITMIDDKASLYASRASSKLSRAWEGDTYSALLDTEKALSLEPENEFIKYLKVECLGLLGRTSEANTLLDECLDSYPCPKGSFKWEYLRKVLANASSSQNNSDNESDSGVLKSRPPTISKQENQWRNAAKDYQQSYSGHCNTTTDIKEAVFIGSEGKYIAAGSDDGRMFIWDRETTNLMRAIPADSSIVNCVQSHPNICLLATSGIESVVKLWTPAPGGEEVPRPSDLEEISRNNQIRMRMDPIEMMIMPVDELPAQVGHTLRNMLGNLGDDQDNDMQCTTN